MIALAELVIDALKYVLRLRMAARHTTKTIPKITAYSTAVWPPSLLTNGRIREYSTPHNVPLGGIASPYTRRKSSSQISSVQDAACR